jgi:Uma2 family endonuclease
VSVTEPGLQRLRMSWDDFLALPERPRAEWVDGEVVVSPPVSFDHGDVVMRLGHALITALPRLHVVTGVGVRLPRNRVRAPDLTVTGTRPTGAFVEDPPALVVEVLSPSTRLEDTVRKSGEYAEGGVGQYWVVDPDHRTIDVLVNAGGSWELLLHLDDAHPTGEVAVGPHGEVAIDLAAILRGSSGEPQTG